MTPDRPCTGRHRTARAALVASLVLVLAGAVATGTVGPGATAGAQTATLPLVFQWSTGPLPDSGSPIAESSPTVATLPGGPAVVVGDRSGGLYARYLTGGAAVPGWPVSTGTPITSTPSVEPLGGSPYDSVFVGAGNAADPTYGGYDAFAPTGGVLWHTSVVDPTTDAQPAYGVQASLAVGSLQGSGPDVVAGSLDQEEYALNAATGSTLRGWPFFTSDSVFSTAALADLYGTGRTEIVEGGDQTAGFGLGQTYTQGGHVRILSANGKLICNEVTNQTVESSPAVGDFLAGGAVGIAVGTGKFFTGAPDTDTVKALDPYCGLQWSTTLDGATTSSPALADVSGDGALDVVEGTQKPGGGGSVYVLTGANGSVLWSAPATGSVIGSVVTADLTGAGYQDLLVPTTAGVDVIDGRSHQQVAVLNGPTSAHGSLGFQNAPLVTADPDGAVGITVAGYGGPGGGSGYIEHYEVPGSDGAAAVGGGSWPEFHHDPRLTGNAGADPAPVPACTVPSAAVDGYDLVASDGGIFSFGGTPFCGSTGGTTLNAPIVGMAMAPNTGGYWLVASDGGIFAYGGARFYGSMGGRPLNEPIVGMAATPDGRGYWLVASDGGIFAFGDAQFLGSMGGQPLVQPIVGIAASPDGRGYRMVASDGGIFAFGDGQFFGSMGGQPLVAPVVGLAVDVATGGYWEVAADGGVFAFNAPFYGSMGGQPLNQPIVGMAETANGTGYRFVAADGGIFCYSTAAFYGSMGGRPLNRPIVGLAVS
ncbi:MAG: hypothetical protein ACRDZR_11555 [Acidimicrobiales bacterium]